MPNHAIGKSIAFHVDGLAIQCGHPIVEGGGVAAHLDPLSRSLHRARILQVEERVDVVAPRHSGLQHHLEFIIAARLERHRVDPGLAVQGALGANEHRSRR